MAQERKISGIFLKEMVDIIWSDGHAGNRELYSSTKNNTVCKISFFLVKSHT
jgi:hypothetical protein